MYLVLGGVLSPGGSDRGCLTWGVSAPGGCLLLGGCLLRGSVCSRGCLLQGCVSDLGGGGVCCRGMSAPGGVSDPGGLPQTCPPVNRMTDRCKNITLATTSLQPVKIICDKSDKGCTSEKCQFLVQLSQAMNHHCS